MFIFQAIIFTIVFCFFTIYKDYIINTYYRQIDEKKSELKNLYNSPEDVFTLKRVGKWTVVQVVKLILGMPVVPGR